MLYMSAKEVVHSRGGCRNGTFVSPLLEWFTFLMGYGGRRKRSYQLALARVLLIEQVTMGNLLD
jgi:hypothetical protein